MTLPQGEMAIIAGFRRMADAEQVKQKLEQLGVIDQRIDRMSIVPVTQTEHRRLNPITGDYPGLASSTFDHEMDRESSVLLSAHPSASGMSDGDVFEAGVDIVLTAVVSREKFDEAEKIVREGGGQF